MFSQRQDQKQKSLSDPPGQGWVLETMLGTASCTSLHKETQTKRLARSGGEEAHSLSICCTHRSI